jgi:hypothetical protein
MMAFAMISFIYLGCSPGGGRITAFSFVFPSHGITSRHSISIITN